MKLNRSSLKDVEIGYPVFAEGVYYARIEKAAVEPNKAGNGHNLVVESKLLDPVLIRHGSGEELVNKGNFKLTRRISLTPSEKYNPDQRLKELAVAIKLPDDQDLNDDDLVGKLIRVKVSVEEAHKDEQTGKEYPMRNDIERFTPIPDDDHFDPGPL